VDTRPDGRVTPSYAGQGWKGTTKARSLVMALREYYVEHHRASTSGDHEALQEIREIISAKEEPDSTKVQEITQVTDRGVHGVHAEDEWALEYITLSRVQPLLEAFDDDASTLVSVSEVNAFSSARPKNWRYVLSIHEPCIADSSSSLPKWMAYWAAGTIVYLLCPVLGYANAVCGRISSDHQILL
jgi:hypothetical protein